MLRVSASLPDSARAAAAITVWQQKILLRFGSRFFPCVLFPTCSRVLYLEIAGWFAGLCEGVPGRENNTYLRCETEITDLAS